MQNVNASTKKQSTQVAEKKTFDIASLAIQEQDLGHDNVTTKDITLPRLKLLGSTSPECNPGGPAYIENARPLMFFNSVTKRLYDGKAGINVVPCYYKLVYKEWNPESQGAPVNEYPGNSDILQQTTRKGAKDYLENGNYIEANGEHYILILDDQQNYVEKAVVYMKSTQFKKSKQWNAMIMNQKRKVNDQVVDLPRWSQVYKLTSVLESGKSDRSWSGYMVNHVGDVNQEVYQIGKAFHNDVKKGDMQVAPDGAEENSENSMQQAVKDEQAPF